MCTSDRERRKSLVEAHANCDQSIFENEEDLAVLT